MLSIFPENALYLPFILIEKCPLFGCLGPLNIIGQYCGGEHRQAERLQEDPSGQAAAERRPGGSCLDLGSHL